MKCYVSRFCSSCKWNSCMCMDLGNLQGRSLLRIFFFLEGKVPQNEIYLWGSNKIQSWLFQGVVFHMCSDNVLGSFAGRGLNIWSKSMDCSFFDSAQTGGGGFTFLLRLISFENMWNLYHEILNFEKWNTLVHGTASLQSWSPSYAKL